MKKVFILGVICLVFWSCTTAPVPRIIVNAFPIGGSFDSVWQAVIETFAESMLPIENMEKDSGLITTGWISFPGQTNEGDCDCGKLGMYVEQSREGKFNVFVKRIDADNQEVKITCSYQQKYYLAIDEDRQTLTRKCLSTGNLEAKLFGLIRSKARQSR